MTTSRPGQKEEGEKKKKKKCHILQMWKNRALFEWQSFLVHKADSTTWVFRPSKKELFLSDVQNEVGHVFIITNKSKYTIKEHSDAVRARLTKYYMMA